MRSWIYGWIAAAGYLLLVACELQTEESSTSVDVVAEEIDPNSEQAYIGKTEKAAGELAEANELPWRVVEREGEKLPVTMDYRPERLNFFIKDGKVFKVTKG